MGTAAAGEGPAGRGKRPDRRWTDVAGEADVPEGAGILVLGGWRRDHPVALFRVEGRLYAVNAVCPHMGGPIACGRLSGHVVTCPWHGWTYDVRTGFADHADAHHLHAYDVRVEDGRVLVAVHPRPVRLVAPPAAAGEARVET
jgi:nitrite reductase (NADH) small subunit